MKNATTARWLFRMLLNADGFVQMWTGAVIVEVGRVDAEELEDYIRRTHEINNGEQSQKAKAE